MNNRCIHLYTLQFMISSLCISIHCDSINTCTQYKAELTSRLQQQFDHFLKQPRSYQKRVKVECSAFPEGDIFPFLFPALAYINLAIKEPKLKDHAKVQCNLLIEMVTNNIKKRLKTDSLMSFNAYNGQAVYLGQLNLLLGAYQLIDPKSKYSDLHNHLSTILNNALKQNNAKALLSFPGLCWPFDTIPVLVSLKLNDNNKKTSRYNSIINQHLTWVKNHATHKRTGLPFSQLTTTMKAMELPRGCDMSFRLCLLPHLSPALSESLYKKYLKRYWLEKRFLAGFAEWPNGLNKFTDMDSGPIIDGIGLGATGLGIGTVFAMNDKIRQQKLIAQLASIDLLRPLVLSTLNKKSKISSVLNQVPISKQYTTGFLFGDAALFYCLTWQQWDI